MRVGIRLWLSAACALVAAVTAAAVTLFAGAGAEDALRARAQDLAAGAAFSAAVELARRSPDDRGAAVEAVSRSRNISLWLFDADGDLATSEGSRRVSIGAVPDHDKAVEAALEGARYISTHEKLNATTVALPLRGLEGVQVDGALLVYAPQPELQENVGIVRGELLHAAGLAVIAGGVVGLVVAGLTARRLRRIGDVATAIAGGDFDTAARPGWNDEIGDLARAIDSMRVHLRASFSTLTSSRERFRGLLERLHEGVIAVDGSGRVEFANRRARTMLRLDLVPGDALPDVWSQVSLRELAEELQASVEELIERRVEPDDDHAYLIVGVPPRGDGAGYGAVIVITDVSERERRERAERQFVANASHELRTPVATIIGAVDVLQKGAKHSPDDRDLFLSHVERAAQRLGLLTETLLVLARVQARQQDPELEPVRLRPLLEEVARELDPAPDVEVEVDCTDDLEALAEPTLAYQAIMNLAANAVGHTRHGRVVLAASEDGDGVTVEVRDTGLGIPSSEHEPIFERFYRPAGNGNDGFGLGLAIVRQAVAAQRATLDLDSVEGVGTTFRIHLQRPEDRR